MTRYVRWKPYGFTHIVNEEYACGVQTVHAIARGKRYGNDYTEWFGTTLCGHTFDLPLSDKEVEGVAWWENLKAKLLAPGKDDGKRPLCGNCRKRSKP